MRRFEIAKGWEDRLINLPQRQTAHSAGYDFECGEAMMLPVQQVSLVPTGVKADMEEGEFLGLFIRSSLAVKGGIMLANSVGVVDKDYYGNPSNDGHIMFPLYNTTGQPIFLKKGERIGQGIFLPFLLVNGDTYEGQLRTGGVGSTTI